MWAAPRTSLIVRHIALAPMSDLAASVTREDVCAPEAREMIAMGAPALVDPGDVDTLVVHGTSDQIVDVADSRKMMETKDRDFLSGTFGHFELLDPQQEIWDTLRQRM